MNKAVVDYYKSDLKKTETFRKQLADICTQVSLSLAFYRVNYQSLRSK